MVSFLHAALLGLLEGFTEFLPISSTGHLILAIELFSLQMPAGKVFEIVIQLGAIFAICWLYRAKLVAMVRGYVMGDPTQRRFAHAILVAFLPAALVGVFAHSFIKDVLFSAQVVGVMLIVGGGIILLIERIKPKPNVMSTQGMTLKKALGIGLCQMVAMIPGTSRSGATMMGALMFGLERKVAAEFSFFLAIPTMLGATVYDLYKNWAHLDGAAMEMIAVGFVAAFLSALLVVRWFIAYISKHGFVPFAYYRIIIGLLILFVLV